jgi:hypothetical protein
MLLSAGHEDYHLSEAALIDMKCKKLAARPLSTLKQQVTIQLSINTKRI